MVANPSAEPYRTEEPKIILRHNPSDQSSSNRKVSTRHKRAVRQGSGLKVKVKLSK